jgi:hypothetical protein
MGAPFARPRLERIHPLRAERVAESFQNFDCQAESWHPFGISPTGPFVGTKNLVDTCPHFRLSAAPSASPTPAVAGCDSDLAQYFNTPRLHHSAWPDSSTACPRKPGGLCCQPLEVGLVPRPREGALHNWDPGEVGRTTTRTRTI